MVAFPNAITRTVKAHLAEIRDVQRTATEVISGVLPPELGTRITEIGSFLLHHVLQPFTMLVEHFIFTLLAKHARTIFALERTLLAKHARTIFALERAH